jgi:hypothetical protein
MAQKKQKPTSHPKAAPGPKPDRLKLKGPWQDAVKKSLFLKDLGKDGR